LPWYHHIALLQKLDDRADRLWYAAAAVEEGWSRNVLVHQIETRLHERSGVAVTNFSATLPPAESDLAQQMTPFDPGFVGQLGMSMAAVDELLAQPEDQPAIGLLLCKTNNVVAEYALRSSSAPIGVAEWTSTISDALPEEFVSSLPSIEALEAELGGSGDRFTWE
jgi:hypothetical protein